MVDVVFITPNLKCSVFNEPTGSVLLTSILKQAGISVQILPMGKFGDVNADFSSFLAEGLRQIVELHPKILSFYTRCDTYHIALSIAQRVKCCAPDIYTVFGGQQSDLCAEDTLNAFPYIDFICRGEGETTVTPFFRSLLMGSPDLSVPGLAYLAPDGNVICNPRPPLLEDFDSIPMIDYQMLLDMGYTIENKAVSVDVGRGCPFNCTFCSTKKFWNRYYRVKNPKLIVQEMLHLYNEFGVDSFSFEHDMFTMNKEKVREVCALISELPFSAHWGCSARIDCVDEALIDTMYAAGLDSIYFGIETGSMRMQKIINKNIKIDRVLPLIRYIVNKGIYVTVSFIYGFPEETEEDLSQTMDLWLALSKLDRVSAGGHLLAFFPGTELEERYRHQLTLAEFYSNQTGNHGVKECYEMIRDNPAVFPQYRELKTELRAQCDFFEQFLTEYKSLRVIYDVLRPAFPSTFVCYKHWREYRVALEDEASYSRRQKNHQATAQLISKYAKPADAMRMQEIVRFLSDKEAIAKAPEDCVKTEIYGFCLQDLNAGKPLHEYSAGFSSVVFQNYGGKLQIQFQTVIQQKEC